MDKFVIHTPKTAVSKMRTKEPSKILKQATIESLKGVVVVEEMERAKVILESEETDGDTKVQTLRALHEKTPGKNVLIKTSIGKTVHKLCKNANPKIASEAKKVYYSWKKHVLSKVGRPAIEVACDLKTQSFRNKAWEMIASSLFVTELSCDETENSVPGRALSEVYVSDESEKEEIPSVGIGKSKSERSLSNLAEYIEREVFKTTHRLINNSYRRTIRKIVFSLKYQSDLRDSVLYGEYAVQKLVSDLSQG